MDHLGLEFPNLKQVKYAEGRTGDPPPPPPWKADYSTSDLEAGHAWQARNEQMPDSFELDWFHVPLLAARCALKMRSGTCT